MRIALGVLYYGVYVLGIIGATTFYIGVRTPGSPFYESPDAFPNRFFSSIAVILIPIGLIAAAITTLIPKDTFVHEILAFLCNAGWAISLFATIIIIILLCSKVQGKGSQ